MQADCREEESRSAREATCSAVQSVLCCNVSPANLAMCEGATAEATHEGGQVGVAGQSGPVCSTSYSGCVKVLYTPYVLWIGEARRNLHIEGRHHHLVLHPGGVHSAVQSCSKL